MGTLRASKVFSDSKFTLIAVESVDFQQSKTNTSRRLYGSVEPIAVVVCGPDGTYALDMEAKPTAIDQLIQYIPELGAIITDRGEVS